MIITIDTEKLSDNEALSLLDTLERYGYKKLSTKGISISEIEPLKFISAQRALIGNICFGSYDKGSKENWYKAICIIDMVGEVFATKEACEKWLIDKYKELISTIVKN